MQIYVLLTTYYQHALDSATDKLITLQRPMILLYNKIVHSHYSLFIQSS